MRAFRLLPDGFVGREAELEGLRDLLATQRLVTLTGVAGVGKSRLALELLARLAPEADDAALVELGPVTDGAAVAHVAASALGLREQPGLSMTEVACAHLVARRAVVVLDNCEHLAAACADLAERLVSSGPAVTVVTTSQEPLRAAGEHVWRVAPLSVPSPEEATVEAISAHSAVRLFVERANAVARPFTVSPATAPVLSEICRRLDGLPLAIELAAARLDVLSPEEISARLEDRFRLLTSGRRTSPSRHASLDAALSWSWDLLDPAEQVLLARCSVFAGGMTLDAIEQVCGGGAVDDPLQPLAGLVAKSLVLTEGRSDGTRYRLLETVRLYARDRLFRTGDANARRARHADWCVRLAEALEPELTGPAQEKSLRRLDADYDNLRAAWDWAVLDGRSDLTAALAGSLTMFWRVRGRFSEGRSWLEHAVAGSDSAPDPARARVLWGAGFLALMAGDFHPAVSRLEAGLALYRRLEDPRGCARSLLVLGNAMQVVTGDAAALEALEESISLAREAGDNWCLAHALGVAGWALAGMGSLADARRLFDESLAVAEGDDDRQSLALALNGLGYVALKQGELELAGKCLVGAAEVAGQLGDPYGQAMAVSSLADLAAARGDHDGALRLLEEGLALARRSGVGSTVALFLCSMGSVALAVDDPAGAAACFAEAEAVTGAAGQRYGRAVLGLGQAALARGDVAAAEQHLGEAEELVRRTGGTSELSQVLSDLGDLARGAGDLKRAMTLHHEALKQRADAGEQPAVASSLESVAGLLVATGRPEAAARLMAASHSLRERGGYARTRREQLRVDADLEAVRASLSPGELEAAWSAGSSLSPAEAAAYASRGRGQRVRATTGWDSLTPAEQRVAALVAEGLSNAEIGERLFISKRTAGVHLSHIYAKLGLASRTELARQAWARQD